MNIGERLKKLRLNAKRTLKEESELVNVSLNTVYRWEHHTSSPRKSSLIKIANLYSVPLEWLVHGVSAGEEDNGGNGYVLNSESITEQKIFKMLRKLSSSRKYKLLGYIERMCVEEGDDEQ